MASSPSERVSDEGVHDAGFTDAASLLRHLASVDGDREAFVDGDVRLTFGAWSAAADAMAARLAGLGVAKGDVVCLLLPSSADYAICYQAAMRLGAITSGINPRLGQREVASIFRRTSPRVTIVDPAVAPDPSPLTTGSVLTRDAVGEAVRGGGDPVTFPDLGLDDPVAIVWTSGTTGEPKGAVFDHGCLRHMAHNAGVLSAVGDRRLSPLPFAHVGYMTRVWDEVIHRITTVILPTPWSAADHLRLIGTERITVGQGVPTQWALVLAHPDLASTDVSSLRIAGTGAAPVPAELVRELRATLGAPVVVRYASTEASLATGTSLDDDAEVVATTVGRPSPGVEVRLLGEPVGEVLVRSRATMRRYWDDPARTAEVIDPDGWVHTGDLGWCDDDGNLHLSGRRTEMYIRGGYNVYPAEVEAALAEHPAVDKVAIVGVPDPILGTIGAAAVVPVDPAQPPSLDELRAWCRDRLANYKAPDRLVIVDQLPLTSMLKVDKRALAEKL